MEKDNLGHSLEDKCSRCKSLWGKDWALCQRCGCGSTVNELLAAASKKPAKVVANGTR